MKAFSISSFFKIYIKNYKIELNGVEHYMISRRQDLTHLTESRIWKKNILNNFGNKTMYHQFIANNNSHMGLVFSRAGTVKINNELFYAHYFGKLSNPLYKQHVFVSYINNYNFDTRPGFMKSVWNEHGLDNPNLYVGFMIKTNLLYNLTYIDNFAIQGGNQQIINLNNINNATALSNYLANKAQTNNIEFFSNKTIWTKIKSLNYGSWYRYIETDRINALAQLNNMSSNAVYDMAINTGNLDINNIITIYRQHHNNIQNNRNILILDSPNF